MNAPDLSLSRLMGTPQSLEKLVIACVLAESQRVGARPLIRGLGTISFNLLCTTCLPDMALDNGVAERPLFDEFEELFELLIEHAEPMDQMSIWLAAAIATAAQREHHLWQDMGLPSRRELSAIMNLRFPRLAAANNADMKWKKFFYRQLCQRAGVPICKSPQCGDCSDQALCFGPET
jgi:nitrogen fixation protein NifQ